MAIKVSNTSVITDARQLANIASLDAATIATINANISSGATVSATAPTASNGAFWIDSNSNVLKTYNQGAWNDIAFVGSGNSFSSAVTFFNKTASSISRTWTVPAGVKVISVVAIGSGGRGDYYYGSSGGGGLAYISTISVTPGSSFSVRPGYMVQHTTGASSTFTGNDANGTSISLSANGGGASTSKAIPAGGTFSGGTGGGNGGTGGGVSGAFNEGVYRYSTPGSGGAGGYSGNGGNGGAIPASGVPLAGVAGSGGAGGGGGGGTDTRYNYGGQNSGQGGGSNLYGAGTSGSGGAAGGLSGGDGGPGSFNSGATTAAANGFETSFGEGLAARGGTTTGVYGAIRIVWTRNGTNSFPSTDVGFKSQDDTIGSVLETQVDLT